MKSIKAIAIAITTVIVLALFCSILVPKPSRDSLVAAQTRDVQVVSVAPSLGPAETVCVYPYPRMKVNCQTLRIGMTSTDVEAVFGKPLPVERSTFAAGTVEHWRYFAEQRDPYKYVYLTFDNDRLDAIHQ